MTGNYENKHDWNLNKNSIQEGSGMFRRASTSGLVAQVLQKLRRKCRFISP